MLAGFFLWRRRPAPARPSAVHGSARWSTAVEARAALGGADGLIVGRENAKCGQLLRYAGPQHLITIAPTRSGKGVGAIIPNLLTADRSVLCVDPKGENARIAVHARQRFGPVRVLDPFSVSGVAGSAFNPLDGLHEDSPDLAEDAALLADALVYDPPGQTGDAHWNEEAKALIAGVIMYVVCMRRPIGAPS
jgi:type IV secretion system protein VirD4